MSVIDEGQRVGFLLYPVRPDPIELASFTERNGRLALGIVYDTIFGAGSVHGLGSVASMSLP